MRGNTKTKQRGDMLIEAAYQHLIENGSATQKDLADMLGASLQTFGSANSMRINEYMRDRNKGHLFRCRLEKRNIIWFLAERNKK
jgi:DNA-binding ferritin-like protein (Dps family)